MKKAIIDYIKRKKFDNLYTPEYAVYPLLKYLPKNKTIWECCDFGGSKITKVLKDNGYKVISTNKKENFFETDKDCDIIVTNPPYSIKYDFLERAYRLEKPFTFLLPITSLEGVKRGMLFRTFGISIIVLNRRIEFTGKGNVWYNVCWFCSGFLPKNTLYFESIDKKIEQSQFIFENQ